MQNDTQYPRALWQISMGEKNLTTSLEPRLISLTLTDNPGLEADQLEVTLTDADGKLDIPERGVTLTLALGRSDLGLIDKGLYTVDEIEHSGTPDQISIKARSANLRETLLIKKERSWHGTTLGAMVRKIAAEHKLKPAISPDLAILPVKHVDQQSESDASLLTRLGEQYDAMAAVKDGRLIFFSIGHGMTIDGTPLPEVTITRDVGDSHRFVIADNMGCKAVQANFYDKKTGKQGSVTLRESDLTKRKGSPKTDPGGSKVRVLRHAFPNQKAAAKAAESELKKALRGAAKFSLSLAQGRPDIFPELAATVKGWKPAIDSTLWRVTKVTHSLTSSGLKTDLELELRNGAPGTILDESKTKHHDDNDDKSDDD